MEHGKNRLRIAKKAFVFSLDMLIAVFVVILVMAASHRYIVNAEMNKVSNMQMVAAGSDIVAMLDYKGALQTLDKDSIESEMSDLLPQNYQLMLKIVVDDGTIIYAGDAMPEYQFTGSGKRYFVVKEDDSISHYAYVTYSVWVK